MKKIFVLLMLFLCCSCSKESKSSISFDDIKEKGNYIIVDVRTKEEYDDGHVVGAINVPYDEILDASLDKDKTIVVYCRSGRRSGIAYDTLVNNGYDAYDLGSYDSIDLEKE